MLFQVLFYTFVTIIIAAILIIYFKIIRPEKRLYDAFRAQGVSGEPFVPLIGQLSQIRRYRKADMVMGFPEDLVRKHGNVFLFSFGPITRLVINEPDMLADVLGRANAQNYIKPPIFNTIFSPIIGHQNLLVAEGQTHERARRMINPAFHHGSLKSMISIITDQTAKGIEAIFSTSNLDQQQTPVDLQTHFNVLTLSIIASSAFGLGFETTTNTKDVLCRTFSEVLDAVVHRSLIMVNQIPLISKLPFWKKDVVDNGARVLAELVDQIIADRRQGRSTSMSDDTDLLDLLLFAVDDEKQPFTDQQIKEQALTFVLAGSETTGNLMAWIFYILMTHDDVLQACREEVDRVLPDGIEPTNEHLAELVICEAVINETLRLYPTAPLFMRYCVREHTIGTERQLRIPVGTTIIVNNYILHRRGDLWPRPLEFDYTRWIRDPKTGLKPKLPHPFAYLPFAAGQRNCIGQNFALLEAKIMLAMFVQRCNYELIPGQKIVPDYKITMRPKYGLLIKVNRRHI
jgi:cytochrome P450